MDHKSGCPCNHICGLRLLTFWLLYRLREVLFLFFVAIVVGTAIRPAVDWLHRRGLSRATGIIIIYLLIAASFNWFHGDDPAPAGRSGDRDFQNNT